MTKFSKLLLLGGATLITACATAPTQYTQTHMDEKAQMLLATQSAPAGFGEAPLDLEGAREMALTRNQSYRQKVDRMLFKLNSDTQAQSLMPQVYANSFGRWRNNTNASVGVKVDDIGADMPEDFYTAQDQSYTNSNLTLSWNLLDVSLSSHRKSIGQIDGFDAVEASRLGCHQLMVDVERAYWRKVAFDKASEKREWLNERIDYALELSDQHIEDDSESRLIELMFQRELIDIKRWYESMYRTLASAESDLSRLINVPHGTKFIVDPAGSNSNEFGSALSQPIGDLFNLALKKRPELRRAYYTLDKIDLENEQQLLRLLPGLNLFVSGNKDSNSFALNQDFLAAGVNLSWDVLNLLNIDETRKTGKAKLNLEEQELSVVASAIMAQVMLAKAEVENLEHEMSLAWKAKDIQANITSKIASDVDANASKETYLVKEELLRELSILREEISRAELKAANARLSQSLGTMESCQAG